MKQRLSQLKVGDKFKIVREKNDTVYVKLFVGALDTATNKKYRLSGSVTVEKVSE